MTSAAPDYQKGKSQFGDVLREELAYLKLRWETVYTRRKKKEVYRQRAERLAAAQGGPPPPEPPPPEQVAPGEPPPPAPPPKPAVATTANGLVGLAFSGGGIRSATINLGATQALHAHGVLDHVDYVSTVSGGGYLGSSMSTIMRDGAEFPYEHREETTESPYLVWLRNHSNYLAERGFLDYARGIAVTFRGILINFVVFLPALLLVAVWVALHYGSNVNLDSLKPAARWWAELFNVGVIRQWSKVADGAEVGLSFKDVYALTAGVAALALFYIFSFPVVVRVFKVLGQKKAVEKGSDSTVKQRDRYERSFSGILLAVAGLAIVESLPIVLYYFHQFHDRGGVRNVVSLFASGSSIAALTMAGALLDRFKGIGKKVILWAVSLLGLLLPLLVVLHVAEALIWDWTAIGVGAWSVLAVVLGLIGGGFVAAGAAKVLHRPALVIVLGLFGFAATFGLVVIQSLAGVLSFLVPWQFVVVLALAIWFLCWLSVDVNLTSVHGFYRDRLASAYLVGVDTDYRRGSPTDRLSPGSVDIEEDLNLQKICQGERPEEGAHPSIAPYHIVNTTHNLEKSEDPGIRERNSDFFMFSKKFYGGDRTGYSSTADLETVFPQMDLATAMAISAAAAAPNMGVGTVKSLVATLTLLNVRLGYWVPNPAALNEWRAGQKRPPKPSLWNRFRWRIPPRALVREALSELDETWRWVYLSDGGHLENLGLYELLRRRCKYIIAGDGEADPEIHFGSLARLKQFARIDLGIEIQIVLDDVRMGASRLSHQHCAYGRIVYPPLEPGGEVEIGHLLYLKSSMTGDEDEVIREYRANHPAFPHESTADQFFDEGQFESYRALGYHIVSGLFEGVGRIEDFAGFEGWFADQAKNLAPTLAAETLFLQLQEELSEVQGLMQRPEYAHFFYLLNPDLPAPAGHAPEPGSPEAAERRRHDDFLVGQQLRLMENVLFALDLSRPKNRLHDGNQGWMTLFRDWTEAWRRDEGLLEVYRSKSRLLTPKLREFCTDLGLPRG